MKQETKSRYVVVTVRPVGRRKYPFKAKLIQFTMKRRHYMHAVNALMCYMGYGATQYHVVSAADL